MSEIGITGLEQYSGVVREEFLRTLQGHRRFRIYREMRDNDPVVGAILFALQMLVRQVAWNVRPASDSPRDHDVAAFVESCFHDMSASWEDTLSEILSFLVFGFSYHEIVYKQRIGPSEKDPAKRSRYHDGRIGWRKLPIRAQETLSRWSFDEDGGISGAFQRMPGAREVLIPIEKALLFRTASHKGNPEGRSILRNAYRPWYFKKRMEEIEAIGGERDLAGLPVIYAPSRIMSSEASAGEKALYNHLKEVVKNIRNDEQAGLVVPSDHDENGNRLYEFNLVASAGGKQFNTDAIIQRKGREIAMVVLADFILLGHDKVGSFALSASKTDLFAVALGAFLDSITAVFNRYAIPRLLELNTFAFEEPPELTHGDIDTESMKDIAAAAKDFALAGLPLNDVENELRARVGLPERQDDYEDDIDPRTARGRGARATDDLPEDEGGNGGA